MRIVHQEGCFWDCKECHHHQDLSPATPHPPHHQSLRHIIAIIIEYFYSQ